MPARSGEMPILTIADIRVARGTKSRPNFGFLLCEQIPKSHLNLIARILAAFCIIEGQTLRIGRSDAKRAMPFPDAVVGRVIAAEGIGLRFISRTNLGGDRRRNYSRAMRRRTAA